MEGCCVRIALCKSRIVGPVSGADETLVTYATYLRDAGHDVEVVTLYPFSRRDPYYVRLAAAGIPIRTIVRRAWIFSVLQAARRMATHVLFVFVLLYGFANHVRGLWTSILHAVSHFYVRRCASFFEANRYDVVHLLTPDSGTPVLIRACRAAGLPTLYQELGSPEHPEADRHYRRLSRVVPLCTRVVALSPALARAWTRRFPHSAGVGVLPLLVAPPRYRAIPRRALPFDVVFGFSGRLERLKGPLTLLSAFARMGPARARPYLRIAGEGPEGYDARRLSFALGIVESCDFVGRYNDVEGRTAFLGTLDVFVLPSGTEGTPNSIIEAMASGIPVIATAVGGIPDIVTPEVGILVPPGDVEALAGAMRTLAQDGGLRKRMGAAARARYQQLFSPEAVVPLLRDAYAAVIAGHRGAVSEGPWQDRRPWDAADPGTRHAASA